MPNNYIELNCTFFELSKDCTQNADNDDFELSEVLGLKIGHDIGWNDMLKKRRVVILSEAGSGKTVEIRQATIKLRAESKSAFFLRLENIPDGIEDSFEEGTNEEFQDWLQSNKEGWIFLDSVDESRLRDPKNFEKAIRIVSKNVNPALDRLHLVITGRANAWRVKTDSDLCNKHFSYNPAKATVKKDKDSESTSLEEEMPNTNNMLSEAVAEDQKFEFYALSNLSSTQVEIFLKGMNINKVREMLDDIERQDAKIYTARPQDLEELAWYWNENNKIGSRLDLMMESIKRRLKERDQDRAVLQPMADQKAYDGVKLIASASTLMQNQNIGVPDVSHSNLGLDVKRILPDWDIKDLITLLGRPVFDEGAYGTVRFHHRSVREFLTAEWLSDLLQNGASRLRVESLFFKEQYGIKVIIPSMRPILSWLIILDDKIREKVCKTEPEILFEGGDPSKLPREIRASVLKDVCEKLFLQKTGRSTTSYSAVKLFSNPDISEEIKKLIVKYKENDEIVSFLIRMIWQGRITDALTEANSFACNDKADKYTRIAAIRAVKEIGSEQDFQDILCSLLSQESKIDRRVLAEAISFLDGSKSSLDFVFKAVEKAENKTKYSSDGLSHALVTFVERLPSEITIEFIRYVNVFLNTKPVIERGFCEISERFGWLIHSGARAVERLIVERHPDALLDESLSILSKIPSFKDYANFDSSSLTTEIEKLIQDWSELHHRLFWKDVEVTRQNHFSKENTRLTFSYQTFTIKYCWSFKEEDFDLVKNEILIKVLLDDKLVALSLAFRIFEENEKPPQWLEELKNIVAGQQELEERLSMLINPPPPSEEYKKWEKQKAEWQREDKKRKDKEQKYHDDWLKWLKANFNQLKNPVLLKDAFGKGLFLPPQRYLLDRMREAKDDHSHWTQGNWQDLIDGFGEDIAKAFRDGLLLSWRFYEPKLRSEKDDENSTPIAVIIGLSGLEIESRETDNWFDCLSEEDIKLACRYAFQELNGFPSWFAKLYERFPKITSSFILKEIDWELAIGQDGKEKHYIIDKVSWNAQFIWDDLAPELLKRSEKYPLSLKYLGHLLKIINSSTVILDSDLAKLASKKCNQPEDLVHLAQWFALWIGVDPESAIDKLVQHLNDNSDALQFAMNVIVNLVGDRIEGSYCRNAYKSPKHLKDLYLLMCKYIKAEEDIDRSGKGAYSPELRDNAQEARNGLFSVLTTISGKEAYLALVELSKNHPKESSRSRMLQNAKKRAEQDADMTAWNDNQFLEYKKSQESTPSNHNELFSLVEQRLIDLKHDLEEGDASNASLLINVQEPKVRIYIGGWLRDMANGRYSTHQEEEFADEKEVDLRVQGVGFDAPVPIELKVADNWSASQLFERLENQLCGDYLRDNRSNKGIFLLVYQGKKKCWEIPNGNQKADFNELLQALQNHWEYSISPKFNNIEAIKVLGISLIKRNE